MKLSAAIFFCMFLLIANIGSVVAAESLGTTGSAESLGTTGSAESLGTLPERKLYDGQPFQNEVVLLDPLKGEINSIPAFFRAIIQILLVFAIPFVVFFIIWAGFLYVTARGNPEKITKAHNALLYAIIGGLLILGSDLLLTVITNTIDQVRN